MKIIKFLKTKNNIFYQREFTNVSVLDNFSTYARFVVKNIIAHNKCEIEVAYRIGLAKPVSMFIETFRTEKAFKRNL